MEMLWWRDDGGRVRCNTIFVHRGETLQALKMKYDA